MEHFLLSCTGADHHHAKNIYCGIKEFIHSMPGTGYESGISRVVAAAS